MGNLIIIFVFDPLAVPIAYCIPIHYPNWYREEKVPNGPPRWFLRPESSNDPNLKTV